MSKVVKIGLGEINEMVKKAVSLLLEISADDCYRRFYLEKFTPEQFNFLMTGAPTMTPLHKVALDVMAKEGWNDRLSELVVKVWTSGNEDMKKYAIDEFNRLAKIGTNRGCNSLIWDLESILEKKYHTEGGYAKGGYHVLNKVEDYLITCTTSYSASKKYFGKSHWCTASDIGGRFNGYEMFLRYTGNSEEDYDEPAALIQFVNTKNIEDETYQVQVYYDGEHGDICNFQGHSEKSSFANLLANLGVGDVVSAIGGPSVLDNLIKETETYANEEYGYWDRKYQNFLEGRKNKILADINGGKYDIPILKYIAKEYMGKTLTIQEEGAFSIYPVNCDLENGLKIYTVIFKGIGEEEIMWMGDMYANEKFSFLNGFNNQTWFVDCSGDFPKIVKKMYGYIDETFFNLGYISDNNDYYSEDYGYSYLKIVRLSDGQLLLNKFKAVCDIASGRPFRGDDGHGRTVLYFEEPVKGTDKWRVAGLDAKTGEYLGRLTIPGVSKNGIWGDDKLIDYNE